MTLENLGNVGEFLGAIAVVTSLIYLSVQVRQNSALQQASVVSAVSDAVASSLSAMHDTETADLMIRGLAGLEPLSDVERFRFSVLMFTVFNSCQKAFYLHQSGVAPEDLWTRIQGVIRFYFENPGVHEWWEGATDRIGPAFVDWVDQNVLSAQERTAR